MGELLRDSSGNTITDSTGKPFTEEDFEKAFDASIQMVERFDVPVRLKDIDKNTHVFAVGRTANDLVLLVTNERKQQQILTTSQSVYAHADVCLPVATK
jgi:hypothetical protein